MSDPDAVRRATIRSFCAVALGMALGIAVLGFFPGYELHAGRRVEVALISSAPLGLAAVLGIFAALVALVWRRPLLSSALLGSMASIGTSVFVLTLTAEPVLEPAQQAEWMVTLPAAKTAIQLVLALVVLQLVLLPVACGLLALAPRRAAARLAPARVHRLGRDRQAADRLAPPARPG
jgi:hypothetical protein